jgi:outer membrane protein TolC
MQLKKRSLSWLILLSSAQLAAQTGDQSFSLSTAVEIATSRSPKVRGMEAKLDEVRALHGVARSDFLPRLGVAAFI